MSKSMLPWGRVCSKAYHMTVMSSMETRSYSARQSTRAAKNCRPNNKSQNTTASTPMIQSSSILLLFIFIINLLLQSAEMLKVGACRLWHAQFTPQCRHHNLQLCGALGHSIAAPFDQIVVLRPAKKKKKKKEKEKRSKR